MRIECDHCVYYKLIYEQLLIIVLYVDVMLIGNSKEMIKELKAQLSSGLDMKD